MRSLLAASNPNHHNDGQGKCQHCSESLPELLGASGADVGRERIGWLVGLYVRRLLALSSALRVARNDTMPCAVCSVKVNCCLACMLLGASMFGKILCIEQDEYVRESRCAVLKYSGFDASSASPRFAEVVLRGREYDLIVLSGLSDFDLQRIIGLADGTEVLVLEEFTMPSELLSLVAQRLDLDRELKA
jgi:hypothetical protein